jgi:predicted metal-dependent hydrolase
LNPNFCSDYLEAMTTAPSSASLTRLDGAAVGIPARHIAFPVADSTATHAFYDGNVLASSLLVVFSAIFPPGERFFMESVRRFRDDPRVKDDPVLAARVAGFLVQEALHGRAHEDLNEFFGSRGKSVATSERTIRASLGLLERLSPRQQLACTTFMEHFTALLAEAWLTDEGFRTSSDPEMLKLWQWHALEELEHKSVAYDVLERVGGTHRERKRAIPLTVVALLPGILYSWAKLVAQDPARWELREHRRGLARLLGPGGFFRPVLAHVGAFALRDFHPDEHDTRALENAWREKLFGDAGMLRKQLKGRSARALSH